MNQAELTKFVDDFTSAQKAILRSKGASYSGATDAEADRLANFKRVAAAMGVQPIQCWLCYFLKHVDSVSTFARTGHESEGFYSRALDIANYALLGAALVQEARHGATVTPA